MGTVGFGVSNAAAVPSNRLALAVHHQLEASEAIARTTVAAVENATTIAHAVTMVSRTAGIGAKAVTPEPFWTALETKTEVSKAASDFKLSGSSDGSRSL